MINIDLPIDPVAKGRPRFTKRGIAYTPTKTKSFEKDLVRLIKQRYKGKPLDKALTVEVNFLLKRPKSVKRKYPVTRPDIDNYLKALFDAMNGVVFKDDSLVIEVIARKKYSPTPNFGFIQVIVDDYFTD